MFVLIQDPAALVLQDVGIDLMLCKRYSAKILSGQVIGRTYLL